MTLAERSRRAGTVEHLTVSRIFASSPDETRVRRATDVGALVTSIVVLALAAWAVGNDTGPELWFGRVVGGAPEWLRTLAASVYAAGGLWALVIVGGLVLIRNRRALLRDVVVAAAIAAASGIAVALIVVDEWPEVLPEIDFDGDVTFPVLRLAITGAILLVALPSLTAPIRRFDRWLIVAMTLAAAIRGYGDLTALIGGLALGVAASAATRLVFGTSVGTPSLQRVRASLLDLGVECDELVYDRVQPADRLLATATTADGPIRVAVYGRDAATSTRASRLWRAMWYRDARSVLGVTREQQAEHAALTLLLGARGGLDVPDVVAVGSTSTGDALLATRVPAGVALAEVDPDSVTDDVLDAIWSQLALLHAADLSHGHIDPLAIELVTGRPRFTDLSYGRTAPDQLTRQLDVVEMLVTTAIVAGPDRAIAGAIRNVDHDLLAASLAVMQPAALGRVLARSVKDAQIDLDAIGRDLAAALDVEAPQLVQLRRVRVRDVVMLALLLVAANAIIGWLTDIDLATFVDEVKDASPAWLLIALILSQLTNVAETVSMTGVVSHPIPIGPTMHFQYATAYIGLAVPSDAGRIAMTIRYLQKLGVPTRIAVGQGPFTTVFGYVIDFVLLVVSAMAVGADLELPDDTDLSGFVTLLTILVVAVVVGVVLVLTVPKLRQRILPSVVETVRELKGSLTDPRRATKLIGGLIVKKLLFALTLLSVVTAFGYPISFATAVFINVGVSWFAGVFPVPGGIGVAEAGFTVMLTAFGVPESAALATAIGHRLLTTYLPTIPGYFSMRKLEREGYL